MVTKFMIGQDEPVNEQTTRFYPEQFAGRSGRYILNSDGEGVFTDTAPRRAYADSNGQEGLLSTARTQAGMPARDITEDSIITYNGIEMRVKEAIGLGLVSKTDSGYQPNVQVEETTQVDIDTPSHALPDDIQAISSELQSQLGPNSYDMFGTRLTNSDDKDAVINEYASTMGVHPAELKDRAEKLYGAMYTQASNHIWNRYGLPGGTVLAWAEKNIHPDDLKQVKVIHWNGSMRGYDELVKAYKRSN